jgi:hypothetical protein
MARVAYIVMVLSAIGVLLCLGLYLFEVIRLSPLPSAVAMVPLAGLFLVWLPTILLMNRLTRDFKQRDFWKAALRGCPDWMRNALWIVVGGAFALFVVLLLWKRNSREALYVVVLFPITFYAVSFCAMYSFIQAEKQDLLHRCLNGHAISALAKFCEECGAPAATQEVRGLI